MCSKSSSKKPSLFIRILFLIFGLAMTLWAVSDLIGTIRDPQIRVAWWNVGMFLALGVLGQFCILLALAEKIKLFWIELALVLISIPVFTFTDGVDTKIETTAADVCNGQKLPSASVYSEDEGIHPIMVVYEATGKSMEPDAYPSGWLPEDMDELELVACIEEEWQTIEVCDYIGGAEAEREQHSMSVEILEAQSNERIIELDLYGDLPRDCRISESFNEGSTHKLIRGNPISNQQLITRLGRFVEQ